MFALFNKDKNFISYSEDLPLNPNFKNFMPNILMREIPIDKRDLTVWRWEGNYDNGEMVLIDEIPYPTKKSDLNYSLFEKIYEKYPIDLQNVIIIKQLKKLCDNVSGNIMTEEFKEMSDLLLKAVEIYEHQNKFYLNNNEK